MTSKEVRKVFLDYFESLEHRVVPSSPLVLPNDPTLLFANAGMNQFKDVFTGKDVRDYRRAASSQKCLRVSGKHNDLEMVGRTPRHHTFFEMLGNFSFGDYFKKEAIDFAWELITNRYGLDVDRLWVTVFGGSEAAEADEEAFALWRDHVGVREDRILRLGEKDNFWRMGDTGPCGPCSEIHYDLGEDLASVDGDSNPETDERRYIEIWNLVFMQFDQQADGVLVPLPAPSVDTGMGLERITSVLQGKRSNYDTDLFLPILHAAAERAGVRLGDDPEGDTSLRVIADHARAYCFLMADGIIPANDSRGYVMRRILRRAIRHGRKLGIEEPFLHHVTPAVIESLGEVFPELRAAEAAIEEVARREEMRFAETLSTGLQMLDQAASKLAEAEPGREPVLPGKDLFRLYDTFGLPLDLARDIAEEQGFLLDEEGFEAEMAGQRARAQASWKAEKGEQAGAVYEELAGTVSTVFEGYRTDRIEQAPVTALIRDGRPVKTLAEGEEGEVVLRETPFYAEAGGQIGDTGEIVSPTARATVLDTTKPVGGFFVSRVRVEGGALNVGDLVEAQVDPVRRAAIRRSHSATHLLHAALREVVGTHVKQAGSRVSPDRFRFDFSHFAPLSGRALGDIESLVNQKILEAIPVETAVEGLEDAVRRGAMALFGEKYGDRVRVVRMGEFSLELCGGTHCAHSAEIGLFKLTAEKGIASGTRRVEALTGFGSLGRFQEVFGIVRELEETLAVPGAEVVSEISKRLVQLKAAQRQLQEARAGAIRDRALKDAKDAPVHEGVKVFVRRVDGLPPSETRELADNLRQKLGSGVVVLGRAQETKASLLVAVTRDLTDRLSAGDLVRDLARRIGGGGGGRKDLAEAGGKDASKLDETLASAGDLVERTLVGRSEDGRS